MFLFYPHTWLRYFPGLVWNFRLKSVSLRTVITLQFLFDSSNVTLTPHPWYVINNTCFFEERLMVFSLSLACWRTQVFKFLKMCPSLRGLPHLHFVAHSLGPSVFFFKKYLVYLFIFFIGGAVCCTAWGLLHAGFLVKWMATLQYSHLEKPMDRGAWWATVLGITQRQTPLRFSLVATSGGYSLVLGAQATHGNGFSVARHRL